MREKREEMLRDRKKVMEKSEWMDAERRRRKGLREDKI